MGSSNFVGDEPACQQCRGLGKPPKGKGRRPGTPKAAARAGFHGTTRAAAENIMSSGFVPSSDGMLGKGVYWSDDATKAKAYGTTVLKLTVMCGKIKKIDQQGHALQKTWSSRGFHTAWVPASCGMVTSELSENCTFDPGRIRVQAVSHDSGDNWEVVARCAACSSCKPESQYSPNQWSKGTAAKCMPCAESAAKEWRAREEAKKKATAEAKAKKLKGVLHVSGAGSKQANGMYRRCRADAYGKPQYCKIDDPHAIIYWYPEWADGGPWWEIGRRWKGDRRGASTPEVEGDKSYSPDSGLGSVGYGLYRNQSDAPTPPGSMKVFHGQGPAPTVQMLG
eukprot:COSAG06_NODE_6802_length_2772_cov_1.554807_1_plen_337_part_00